MEDRVKNLEEIVRLQSELLQSIISSNDLFEPVGTYDKVQRVKELMVKEDNDVRDCECGEEMYLEEQKNSLDGMFYCPCGKIY